MLHPFFKEESTPTSFFVCPACGEVISLGNRMCRFCSVSISAEMAHKANREFQRVQDACARANTLRLTKILAILYMVADPLFMFLMGGDRFNRGIISLQILPPAAVLTIVGWFLKYRDLKTKDRDYPEALREMKRTLALWLLALAVQIGVLIVYLERWIDN